jgi:hypothetical protein
MHRFDAVRVAVLQPHALSLGRVIFLVAIVVTFCALFIGFYVWMRRPDFGQGGADQAALATTDHRQPADPGRD